MPNSPIVLETNPSSRLFDTNPQSIVRNSDSYLVNQVGFKKLKVKKKLLMLDNQQL